MIDPQAVKKRLHQLGVDKAFWGKPELAELPKILIQGEIIEHVRHGHYKGGFATLVATNHRLLLVDKKPFFLNVEDIRYDMIAEVDYGHQLMGATIHVRSFSKDFRFQSLDKPSLREITGFIQHKVMETRGQKTEDQAPVQHQAIPMQVFATDSTSNSGLTDDQATGLLPLDQEKWYKHNPERRAMNPYTQTPLVSRRRVGRFSFANDR